MGRMQQLGGFCKGLGTMLIQASSPAGHLSVKVAADGQRSRRERKVTPTIILSIIRHSGKLFAFAKS